MNQGCEFSFYFLVFHTFPRLLHLKMPLKNQDCSSLIRRQFDNFTATHLKREVGWNFFHSLTLIFNIPSSLLDNDNPWYSNSKKVHFLLEMSHAKWGFQEMKWKQQKCTKATWCALTFWFLITFLRRYIQLIISYSVFTFSQNKFNRRNVIYKRTKYKDIRLFSFQYRDYLIFVILLKTK